MGIGQKLAKARTLAKFRRIAGTYDAVYQARWLADNAQHIEFIGSSVKLPELGLHFPIDHPCASTILKKIHFLHSLHRRARCAFTLRDNDLIATVGKTKARLVEQCDIETFFEVFGLQYYVFSPLPGDTVFVDVGMNIGIASLQFHSQHQGVSYGFELMPSTFIRAKENFSLNPILHGKHFSYDYGLSNSHQEVSMIDIPPESPLASLFSPTPPPGFTTVSAQVQPAANELSKILATHPASHKVLKLDVEGSEFEILGSLQDRGLLDQFSIVFVEVHPRLRKKPDEITDYLQSSGFVWSRLMISDNGVSLVSAFNTAKLKAQPCNILESVAGGNYNPPFGSHAPLNPI